MSKKVQNIESFVYSQLLELKADLKLWSTLYKIDPRTLSAILLVERQQYNLKDARSALKRAVGSICDFIDNHPRQSGDKWVDLPTWVNNSRGFARIKYETAKRVMMLQPTTACPITPHDLVQYRTTPALAIKIAACILRIHLDQWSTLAGPLSLEVLATLYNISDFINKQPHSKPQPGGSILPAIIDGQYIEGLNFGERVLRVYNSEEMARFIKKLWL